MKLSKSFLGLLIFTIFFSSCKLLRPSFMLETKKDYKIYYNIGCLFFEIGKIN